MHVADVPLSMQALESYVKDESAPDAQALSKALFGDDINYFWHDATCAHTVLQEMCASCPSSVQKGWGHLFLAPAGGLQAERGTDGIVMGQSQARPHWVCWVACVAPVGMSCGAGLTAAIVVSSGYMGSASARGVFPSSWRSRAFAPASLAAWVSS